MTQREDVAKEFKKALEARRGMMEKCLACAFEALQVLVDLPAADFKVDGEDVVDLEGMFARIEQTLGMELSEISRTIIHANLLADFNRFGGLASCTVWTLGHAIEHAVEASLGEAPHDTGSLH